MPSVLKHFGLAKAIEVECRKVSEQWHLPVSCACSPLPAGLDPIVQLNCFKIVQEALQNAGQHSHATSIAVSLTVSSNELLLEVADDGLGFDMKQAPLGGGLGLITMGVRVRLIGGQAEVRSQPGQGTRIVCRAPLAYSEQQPRGSREETC
jgi:signal transduction histidine kinase